MDENKTVILDVDLNIKDATKRAAELQLELVKLRQEQKKLDTTTEEGQVAYQRLAAEIKGTGTQMRKQQDIASKLITTKRQESGALEQLRNQLSAATAAYDALSESNRKASGGLELKDQINNITAVLGPAEEATNRHQRSVGNYAKALRDATALSVPFAGELTEITQALGVASKYLEKNKLKLLYVNFKTIASDAVEWVGKKTLSLQTWKNSAAEAMLTAAKGKGIIVTKAATVSAWLLNAALAPIALVIYGIVAAAAGMWGLVKVFGGSADAAKAAEKATAQFERQVAKTAAAISKHDTEYAQQIDDQNLKNRERIAALKKNGATEEQIAKERLKGESQTRKIQQQHNQARLVEMEKQEKEQLKALNAEKKALSELKKGSDKYKEREIVVDGLIQSYYEYLAATNKVRNETKASLQDQAEAEIKYNKEVSDATFERLTKHLDQQKAFNESHLKAEAGYQSRDFATKRLYTQRLFEMAQMAEGEKLALQRRFGKITSDEHAAQLDVMRNAYREFAKTQTSEAEAYYASQREALLAIFDKNTQERIDEVNAKFEQARKNLAAVDDQKAPERQNFGTDEEFATALKGYNNFLYHRATMELRMQQQQAAELKAIHEQDLRTRAEQIEKQITEQYQGDIRKYQDNERKKTEILIEQLEAQKAAKLKENQANPDQPLDTFDEEAGILESKRRLNQMFLDSELISAQQNAKSKYEARKEYLEREKALMIGNAEQQSILSGQSIENEQEYREAMIAEVELWANKSMAAMGAVNDLFNAFGDRQVQKAEEDHARESESLQNKLDSGLISQEEHDKKRKDLDKDLDKEQKKIARQKAIREKAMAMFQIAIDTAIGLAKLWVNPAFPAAIPLAAVVGAMGAIQLATVAAQPLPKAARGRKIKGKSHGQGGEMVVAENGEIIMNKRSVAMFEPLLSEMSVAGGGIPFGHISDGGYTARYAASGSTSEAQMREAVSRAMKQTKIYVTVEDIRRGDASYAKVIARGDL